MGVDTSLKSTSKQPGLRRRPRTARLAEGEEIAAVRRLFQPFLQMLTAAESCALSSVQNRCGKLKRKRLALCAGAAADVAVSEAFDDVQKRSYL